jgi:DNA-binding response OmpR family regulator
MALSETDNDLSIRVNISKLKQKIDINIINIRGVGYKLA